MWVGQGRSLGRAYLSSPGGTLPGLVAHEWISVDKERNSKQHMVTLFPVSTPSFFSHVVKKAALFLQHAKQKSWVWRLGTRLSTWIALHTIAHSALQMEENIFDNFYMKVQNVLPFTGSAFDW